MPQGRGNGRNEAILRKLNRARVDEANENRDQIKKQRHSDFVAYQNKLGPGGSKSVRADQYKRKPGKTVKIRKKGFTDKLADYWDDTIQGV